MTETRAARVEQNTRQKAESSTLYQVYRCINNIRDIVISNQNPVHHGEILNFTCNKQHYKRAEQSGNIAEQWFARKGEKG